MGDYEHLFRYYQRAVLVGGLVAGAAIGASLLVFVLKVYGR
jgi:hypothetical protein